jgi:hypothetical protein
VSYGDWWSNRAKETNPPLLTCRVFVIIRVSFSFSEVHVHVPKLVVKL